MSEVKQIRLRPLNDRCIIERESAKSNIHGSIILVEDSPEKSLFGKVIRIGPGYYDPEGNFHPTTLKPGDTVMMPKHVTELTIEGELYCSILERDIIGLVEKK